MLLALSLYGAATTAALVYLFQRFSDIRAEHENLQHNYKIQKQNYNELDRQNRIVHNNPDVERMSSKLSDALREHSDT